MPKRSLKKTLINNLTSRRRNSSQEHLEEHRHETGQVSQTSHSDDSFQDNLHENNQVSARPTRAAKVRCLQNLTNVIRIERSYDLDVSRERASQRVAAENDEQREQRLQDLRQRAAQRLATENEEQRERRLRDMRQRAAQRLANENDEQRERRLQDLRQRAAYFIISSMRRNQQKTLPNIIRTDYKCNECGRDIVGCRYMCVQCARCDVCAACEARGADVHHYALRVPPHKHTHKAMAILERIRYIINTEKLEVNIDETKRIKCDVDNASDPEAIVKMEMLDIGEYELTPQIKDHASATIKDEAQGGEGNKRQQRHKRRAPSPDTSQWPVTLTDTHTHIAHNQLALLTETQSITRTKTKALSDQVSVPTSSKTMPEQTPPTYEVPMMTPPNVNAPVILNQATCSLRPNIECNIPKTENSDELQPDQVLTSATSSSQAQVVSLDPQPAVEEIIIKIELSN